jgi:hypothetical protein
MKNLKDGGFIRQLENFNNLLKIAEGMGESYNPVKGNLKISALSLIASEAKELVENWVEASHDSDRTTSLRREAMDELSKFVTSISREVKVCGIKGEVLSDIKLAIRKFRGSKLSENAQVQTIEDGAKKTKGNGVSATIERKIHAFYSLVELLANTPEYESNDTPLQVEGLRSLALSLQTKQQNYMSALLKLDDIRQKRDKIFFNSERSITYNGQLLKNYLRNQFKGNQTALKTINAMVFATPLKS